MSTQCLECGYSVTEPICASCVVDDIKVWVHRQGTNKLIVKKINNQLKSFLGNIELLDYVTLPSRNAWNLSIMKCIRCKKGMHLMCFYCATHRASQIINDSLKSESSIANFHEYFDTDNHNYELPIQWTNKAQQNRTFK